eukprot:108103_1
MDGNTERLITFPTAILSIIFTVMNMVITIYLMALFFPHSHNIFVRKQSSVDIAPAHIHSNQHQNSENYNVDILSFYKYTATIAVLFNTLCSFFNTIFCLYLILDPEFDDEIGVYVYHPSHNYRILSTVSWYIAQIMVILVFTGRLYNTFEGSTFAIKKKVVIYINVLNIITVLSGLICGYYGVFKKSLILAEIGLNLIGRILYEVISFIVLYMFSKRLLALTILNESLKTLTTKETTETNTQSKSTSDTNNSSTSLKKKSIKSNLVFLAVATRNAILMLTVSFGVVLVTICFFGFRFIFGTQSRLTLLIPMNMAAFDSINTSICILCLFRYGRKLYYVLCGRCDVQCKQMCLTIGRKYC